MSVALVPLEHVAGVLGHSRLEEWSWRASVIGGLLALFGFPIVGLQLWFARKQQQDANRHSTSQVLLATDSLLANHFDVAQKLRPRGSWYGSADHPDGDEMPLVEPYLGAFERLFVAFTA